MATAETVVEARTDGALLVRRKPDRREEAMEQSKKR